MSTIYSDVFLSAWREVYDAVAPGLTIDLEQPRMHSITTQKYIVLQITPLSLPCAHWDCTQPTDIAHLEACEGGEWIMQPVCPIHGYAEYDPAISHSHTLQEAHRSVKRFLIYALSLDPATSLTTVRICRPSKAKPYGYQPPQPPFNTLHIDDKAWYCRIGGWNTAQGVYVVWSFDDLEFSAYPTKHLVVDHT